MVTLPLTDGEMNTDECYCQREATQMFADVFGLRAPRP
jgi:hypothetical protein